MKNYINYFFEHKPQFAHQYGWLCFQIGLLLLPSTIFVSSLFLLPSLILGSFNRRISFFSDWWNYPLIMSAILMLIGSLHSYTGWLAWVGLANWIPFFWCFWGFQPYLLTSLSRKRAAFCFLVGSLPVVITGFGQLWFGWHGPWQLFNGLIVWFISPGGQPQGRLSGLFDYANIAGAWLALIWPFCLASLIQPFVGIRRRIIALLFAIAVVSALILTDSRNAWGGLVLGVPFVLGMSSWFWLLPLMTFLLIPIGLAIIPGIHVDLQEFARTIVPQNIWSRLNDMQFQDTRPIEATRINQWKVAISLVLEKPFLGWGAAAFSILYPLKEGLWHGHAHNLPLELAVSNGSIVALSIVLMVFALLIASLNKGILFGEKSFNSLALFDRAWWSSILILVCLHSVDIPLFDSRINMAAWILLSGLRCFLLSID